MKRVWQMFFKGLGSGERREMGGIYHILLKVVNEY